MDITKSYYKISLLFAPVQESEISRHHAQTPFSAWA